MIRFAILAACALAVSCDKSPTDAGGARTKIDHVPFDRCLDVLERIDLADPQIAAAIAHGCSAACPDGLSDFAKAARSNHLDEEEIWNTLSSCELACSKPAESRASAAPVADRFRTLAEDCGLSYYQLPADHNTALTPGSAMAARVHQWLRSLTPGLDDARRQRLDKATTRVHLPLSPPSSIPGGYELPRSRAGQVFQSPFYVVIGRGAVRAAARPVVRLRGQTLELRPVPGGPPPGQVLSAESEQQQVRQLEESWKAMHPAAGAQPRYTYLVDGAEPTERLLSVAKAVGHRRFHLSVAGLAAREHKVELAASSGAGTAAPMLKLAAGELSFGAGDGKGSVAEQLRRVLVSRAPTSSVELSFEPGTSVAELVSALDVIAGAGGTQAILSLLPQ